MTCFPITCDKMMDTYTIMKSCTILHKNDVTFNIDVFSTSYYHKSFSTIIITSQNFYHSEMLNFVLILTAHGYVHTSKGI